jgi:hypothetical protein
MATVSRGYWFRVAGATVGVLATLCFAGTVQASCGDYLLVSDQYWEHQLDGRPGQLDHNPERSRCRGPECRGGTMPAPQSPPLHSQPPRDSMLKVVFECLESTREGKYFVMEGMVLEANSFCAGIFRPPRSH